MRLFRLVVVFLVAALPHLLSAQSKEVTWEIDGVKRRALVFAPASPGPAPLVFVFHGHGGNIGGAAQHMEVQHHWPEAVVVYPQGLDTASQIDPAGSKSGWQHEIGENGDRDLKFVDAMLASLGKEYQVNPKQVYCMGMSNGAMFSYLLWVARPDMCAAIAAVAGRLMPELHPKTPKPLLHIAGKKDPLVKFEEQQETVNEARKVDQAEGDGQECGPNCTFYRSKTHTPVVFRVHEGGHAYPVWASEVIVKFFQNHGG